MNLLAKAAIGALVAFGATKVLQKTGIFDKLVISAVNVGDTLLTKANEALSSPKAKNAKEQAATTYQDVMARVDGAMSKVLGVDVTKKEMFND